MPFSSEDLEAYVYRHRLDSTTCDYLRNAAAGPSRDVGTTGYRAVTSEVPSRKMGTSVATESRRGELAYALFLEHDDDVVAYYEQPPAVDCLRTNRKSVRATRIYHPDFLVLRRDGPFVAQVKTAEKLAELVATDLGDWVLSEGIYRDLPAERAFEAYRLQHVVVSTASLPPIRIANLQLLLRVRQSRREGVAPLPIDKVRKKFRQQAVLTLAELAASLELTDLTALLQLIDEGVLHVALDRQLLADAASCCVALLPELLDPAILQLQGAKPGVNGVSLDQCPPQLQAERGLANLERLATGTARVRTARRHRAAIRVAARIGMNSFQAVTPKYHQSGNRSAKRPTQILEHARQKIKAVYGSALRLTPTSAYRLYCADAREKFPGIAPVSKPTFLRIVEALRQETAYARGGKRLANALEAPTPVEERAIQPTRPFECATCDHYLADVRCVLLRSSGRTYTAQPWITVLRDIYSGVVLSVWIGFRAPSRIACAMVLRSCLRRHGRLPEAIVVDQGAEFRSVYFGGLQGHCGITAVYRPPGDPRFGSEAERFFGLYKTQWLNLRPGNTALHVEARSVSGSHRADATADIEIADLISELWRYCDWQQSTLTPSQTLPPLMMLREGLARFPFSGRQVPYDEAFIIASAVDETRISLDPARGLKLGAHHYWHPALSQPTLRCRQIEVRREPEDHTCVYVRVGDRWLTCVSSQHPAMTGKSEIARLAASVVAMDGARIRAEARRDADYELVQRIREADEQLALRRVVRLAHDVEVQLPADDAFIDLDDVEMPLVTTWEVDR